MQPDILLTLSAGSLRPILAAKDPRCAYVDTASATLANSAHFDTAGTLDVGRRFAEALLAFEARSAPAK